MSLLDRLLRLLERLTGTHIYRSLPPGTDFFFDIARSLPLFRAGVVFDVGANVGQSAKQYARTFPTAHIYSFEPVSETFHRLQENVKAYAGIECFQLALGSLVGVGQMVLRGPSPLFFLQGQSKETPASAGAPTEAVDVSTLDEFCQSKGVSHIDFLKVDTEGADLEVLKGADGLLTMQKIDLVQVEAGMNPANSRHVPFELLKAYLEVHGYFVFRIYEQVNEWPTREPQLRRVDAVFVSRQMIGKNRAPAVF